MVDLSTTVRMQQLNFTSDASANPILGFGATFNTKWIFAQWEPGYIDEAAKEPSIAYL